MSKKDIIISLSIALLVGIIAYFFSSSKPDGLEKVLQEKIFIK